MPSKGPIFIEDVENPYPIRSMPFGRVCPEGAAMWHKKKELRLWTRRFFLLLWR